MKKASYWRVGVTSALLVVGSLGAEANTAVKEAAKRIIGKFGAEVAEEVLTKRLAQVATRHGAKGLELSTTLGYRGVSMLERLAVNEADDVVRFFGRSGVRAVGVIDNPKTLSLLLKHGDAAGAAMLKHPGIGADVIGKVGGNAVGALNAVSTGPARQLTSLVQAPPAGLDVGKLLPVIEKYGDKAMEFVWRNKGALAVTAGAAAFVSNPEPYIDGAKALIVEPIATVAGEGAKAAFGEMAKNVDWGWIVYPGAAALFLGFGGIRLLRRIGAQWTRFPRSP